MDHEQAARRDATMHNIIYISKYELARYFGYALVLILRIIQQCRFIGQKHTSKSANIATKTPQTATHQCWSAESGEASLQHYCVFESRVQSQMWVPEQLCWLERLLSEQEPPSLPPLPSRHWRAPEVACCQAQKKRGWAGSPNTSASWCYLK